MVFLIRLGVAHVIVGIFADNLYSKRACRSWFAPRLCLQKLDIQFQSQF